ncbi:MAG: DUF475 domain-containing protein [Methanomethylovorans sp.]|nr:DUF475 domain-containing protein [Methanomethylovorans sp.]
MSKTFYLEIINATFSIDAVIGAFAFTLSVPLIILGKGLGAFFVRELTISNIYRIQRYMYLKNRAMYSILFLGLFMIRDGFRHHIPSFLSPMATFFIVGYFFYKSKKQLTTAEIGSSCLLKQE